MATLNYQKRLSNLQNRRYDYGLNESVLSKSFSSKDIPDNVKYLLESMKPIEKKYNDITLNASEIVHTHIEKDST